MRMRLRNVAAAADDDGGVVVVIMNNSGKQVNVQWHTKLATRCGYLHSVPLLALLLP